jgi:hypothetical protein
MMPDGFKEEEWNKKESFLTQNRKKAGQYTFNTRQFPGSWHFLGKMKCNCNHNNSHLKSILQLLKTFI